LLYICNYYARVGIIILDKSYQDVLSRGAKASDLKKGLPNTKEVIAMSASVSYVDRKGEAGAIEFSQGTFNPANFVTSWAPLSYVGYSKYRITTETELTDPPAVGTDALVNNDKDFKAILGFEGADGFFKISIPACKVNIEGGICIRWGQNPVKDPGEVGADGALLVSKLQAVTGLTGLKFVYGRLLKKS
jgi:hypothetical protein